MSVNSKMTAIADEIRELSGTTGAMGLDAMASTLNTENTNFASNLSAQNNLIAQIQTALEGKAGGSAEPVLQEKTVTPTTSVQNIIPDSNYDGLSKVTVNPIPSNYIVPSGTKTITTNGTHDVKAYASATVNIAGEDVTSETNAYTSKLVTLETAIIALETELQGKASGGGSGGGSVETCTVTISVVGDSPMLPVTMFYVDSNGQPTSVTESIRGIDNEYIVQKNNILVFDIEADSYTTATGGVTILSTTPMLICGVTGDGSIAN
jgi:hypothetical protein